MHGDENDAHEPTRSERRAADRGRARRASPKQSRRTRAARADAAAARPPTPRAALPPATVARAVLDDSASHAAATVPPACSRRCSWSPRSSARWRCPPTRSCRAAATRHPAVFSLSVAEAQNVDVSALASGAPVSSDALRGDHQGRDRRRRGARPRPPSGVVGASSHRAARALRARPSQAEGDDYPWWNETARRLRRRALAAALLLPRVRRLRRLAPQPRRRRHERARGSGTGATSPRAAPTRGPTNGCGTAGRRASEPVVGAVAWFPYNHVAYVQSINADGSVNDRGVQPELRPLVPPADDPERVGAVPLSAGLTVARPSLSTPWRKRSRFVGRFGQ